MYGWRARLGFVLASSNGIVEAESMKMVPDGVSCHFTRVLYKEITKEGALGIVQATEEAGRLLAGGTNAVGVDVVSLTHSEASMARGPHGDKEIIKLIEKATGVKATTTATGIVFPNILNLLLSPRPHPWSKVGKSLASHSLLPLRALAFSTTH